MRVILTRGHPALETPSAAVEWPDQDLASEIASLHEVLADFRRRNGFGRAIAAPQVGISKRLIALNLGARPFALINPEITWRSEDTFEVWDDCLSVPDHVVRVRRHCSISLTFDNERGERRSWNALPPTLSELVQHEMDHLDGVLMTERAVDADSIRPIAEHTAVVGASRPTTRLSLAAIAEAAQTVDPVFRDTPQYDCEPLSAALGCSLTLKIELCNPIRSFKGRGADYCIAKARARGEQREIVCASAGNFGQALAYACRKHQRALIVYASTHASAMKIERMRAFGATVRLVGDDFDAAKGAARAYCAETGGWMVEDGFEPEISEGAGTIGLELLARGDTFDALTVSLGGGALLNGIALWVKASSPSSLVYGVSAERADAMEKSWRSGTIVSRETAATIADGIAVRVPIKEAVDDMRGPIDDVLLVSEHSIIEAMRLLYRHAGLLVEPAGAAGVAAILCEPDRFRGKRVATVLCGGNLGEDQISEWLRPVS